MDNDKDYYIVKIPKDRLKLAQKAYYERNREMILEKHKKSYESGTKAIYYEANKDIISEKRKQYYQKNREKILAKDAIYRANRKAKDEEYERNKEKLLQIKAEEEKQKTIVSQPIT